MHEHATAIVLAAPALAQKEVQPKVKLAVSPQVWYPIHLVPLFLVARAVPVVAPVAAVPVVAHHILLKFVSA